MNNNLYELIPYPVKKPWAGEHLCDFSSDKKDQIGELVIISDLPQFHVKVNKKKSFRELWQSICQNSFPYMIKILSTKKPLSLQVHPSNKDIKTLNLKGMGKSEAWAILNKEKDAQIFLGLENFDNKEKLFSNKKSPFQYCNHITPKVHETFLISPGLVHGTMGSLCFYEAQQSSDHTFRIFDYNENRPLHHEQAREVIQNIKPLISKLPQSIQFEDLKIDFIDTEKQTSHELTHQFTTITFLGNTIQLRHKDEMYQWSRFSSAFFLKEDTISWKKTKGFMAIAYQKNQ